MTEGLLVNLRFNQKDFFLNSAAQSLNSTKLQGTRFTQVSLVQDFKVNEIMTYNETTDQVNYSESKLYHAVCPYNTYPLETYCYN